jgi:hypothetical protein
MNMQGYENLIRPACARLWLLGEVIHWIQSRRAIGVMSDRSDKLEISACVRGDFEAWLEQELV